MSANREYKSSVFSMLFGEPAIFIELYNALSGKTYPLNTIMEPATLTDVLFMEQQNDVAFVIGEVIVVLIEHQASINQNMPLRLLLYIARVYEQIIDSKAIYKETLLKIPTPEFIVLYNGMKDFPKEMTLRLSDAFKQPPTPGLNSILDLSVRVVNINKGYNQEIIKNSNHLKDYTEFIAMVRENQRIGKDLRGAITKAVSDCLNQGILVSFLNRHASEVINLLIVEFNIDIAKQVWQEEAREEGIEKGREEGIEKGRAEGRIIAAVNAIKNWGFSLINALALVGLDETYRDQLILELKEQGVEFTESDKYHIEKSKGQ